MQNEQDKYDEEGLDNFFRFGKIAPHPDFRLETMDREDDDESDSDGFLGMHVEDKPLRTAQVE